ncbi:protein of unknown function [Candidatus Methylocalor cossyra]|uniref:Uncharacterized protein n=1 Tax=Candidatus Methylocalor cossyra TaxID=3108543 RepID=A0ABM9NKQ1_9GAMM
MPLNYPSKSFPYADSPNINKLALMKQLHPQFSTNSIWCWCWN